MIKPRPEHRCRLLGLWVSRSDKMAKFAVLIILAYLALAYSAPVNKAKLRLKVSGRNLPDKDTGLGTSDVYFELFVTTDMGRSKTKLTRSNTINDQENPDWGGIFEADFDRSKNQWLLFYVWDEDNLREDDTVGRGWMNLADYVDKGQSAIVRLDKDKGYLMVKSADRVEHPVDPKSPLGQLALPSGTPENAVLKFKVSAQNLPTKDDVGFIPGNSDPYVIITATDGVSGKERDVGRSATVSSTSNPSWGDVFTFNWSKSKDQYLKFKIYDDDTLREDDKLGVGWISVNDFVAHNQVYTLVLPKKGTLTMSRA